jgi:hypothetical protein
MEDSQHTHVEGLEESPDKMWKTLEDIYVQKRPNSRFMALSSLLSISKQPEEPLPVVSTRVEQAVKDVKTLCPKDYTMEQLYDDLCCMAMIRSLGPDYSSFVSSISLMDDINMSKLKSAFLTEESNRRAMEAHSGPIAAASLAASSYSSSSSTNSTPFVCGWCQKPWHNEENCFMKKNSQQQDREYAKQNRARGRGKKRYDTATKPPATPATPSTPFANVTEVTEHASVHLSETSSHLTPSTVWCSDSGATSHMTPHRVWFKEYTPYVVPIRIANGDIIYSEGMGSVC